MIPPSLPELVAAAVRHPYFAERVLLHAGATAHGRHNGLELTSQYQPIFDVGSRGFAQSLAADAHAADRFGDDIGYQARTQAASAGAERTPVRDPFDSTVDDQDLVALDRLSRLVHAINFFGVQRSGLLFLNVHERLLKSVKYDHGRHFSTVLVSLGLNPARVVIELPEMAVAHRTFLGYLTKSYQSYGFKVAGNLPNAGQILSVSDMARLDFIKMNSGSALRDAVVKPLVSYASRLKIPLIFTHVMDEAQFELLQQYDVRYVQGPVFDSVGSI
ncbi:MULTISPECIES: EAL domain-containing protein [Mycetohabitans]|uniref:EAL domain-containing protein n=1 Tax=Mycetohabitans TaxID=2571159 RepID=UPI001F37C2F8|nr:EAL domain-containing protein [Mycetohabitans sp. B3]MCF2134747.1 EAL domain-containing protein [Mycetohabitans sp. B3]